MTKSSICLAGIDFEGKYIGGRPVLGYDIDRATKKLIVNELEAERVQQIFDLGEAADALAAARQGNYVNQSFQEGSKQPDNVKTWGFENSLPLKASENAIYRVFHASIDLDLGW